MRTLLVTVVLGLLALGVVGLTPDNATANPLLRRSVVYYPAPVTYYTPAYNSYYLAPSVYTGPAYTSYYAYPDGVYIGPLRPAVPAAGYYTPGYYRPTYTPFYFRY